VREHYPHIPLILDAKRGDIGATARSTRAKPMTATVPMPSRQSLHGFRFGRAVHGVGDRGVIILCRTSNAGGSDLQFLNVDGKPLYQHVAQLVAQKWNRNGQCALVVGATFPEELAQVRAIVGDMPLLVPGIGAQGGDIAATVKSGRTPTAPA
jgi:orotidine-5'-phosphate decarboxylase